MAQAEQVINPELLESICKILGEQNTGTEIGHYLAQTGIEDTDPGITKWRRLYSAFAHYQNENQRSNKILIFIKSTLNPGRHINNKEYEQYRSEINKPLLFLGYELGENGRLRKVIKATTITEAEQRADRLQRILKQRDVHQDVLRFCKAELLQDNYFHAVFESTKSVADKIREKSGLGFDGTQLIDTAFGLGNKNTPMLAFNSLQTETEESEHKGFVHLTKGMFGMFRNITAHVPKIKWEIEEPDALDCLTLASMLHRKLDKCYKKGD